MTPTLQAKADVVSRLGKNGVPPPFPILLRKIFYRLKKNCHGLGGIVITGEPKNLIDKISAASGYIVQIKHRLRISDEEVWREIVLFVAEYGGIIITTDCQNRYIFNENRMDLLVKSADKPERLPKIDLNARLAELMGEHVPPRAVAGSTMSIAEKLLPPGAIRKLVCGVLAQSAPSTDYADQINELYETITTLVGASVTTPTEPLLKSAALAVAMKASDMVKFVEEKVIEILGASVPASAGESPPTAAITDVVAWRDQAHALEQTITKLRHAQDDAEEDLETLKSVVNLNLHEQLRLCAAEDKAPISAALGRAEAKKQELQEYIDSLVALRQPLEARWQTFQKYLYAHELLKKPLSEVAPTAITLPAPPEVNEEELLSWRTAPAVVPKEKPTMIAHEKTPAAIPKENSAPTAQTAADVTVADPPLSADLADLPLDCRMILAAYKVIGQRSSLSLFRAMRTIHPDTKSKPLYHACDQLHRVGFLKFCGKFHDCYMYRVTEKAEPINPLDYFSPEEIEKLRAFFPKKR